MIWNRACERLTGVAASEVIGTTKHWQAFYETKRHCLADLVALDRPEQLPELYSEYAARGHNGLGFSAENWCVMPKLGSQLYLAIDAGPIHDEAGHLIAVVETLRDLTDQKRAEMALKELATKDGLTGLSSYFATSQTYVQQNPVLVSYIVNKLHKTKIAIVLNNTPALNETQQSVMKEAQAAGLNIVRNSRIGKNASDSEIKSAFILVEPGMSKPVARDLATANQSLRQSLAARL